MPACRIAADEARSELQRDLAEQLGEGWLGAVRGVRFRSQRCNVEIENRRQLAPLAVAASAFSISTLRSVVASSWRHTPTAAGLSSRLVSSSRNLPQWVWVVAEDPKIYARLSPPRPRRSSRERVWGRLSAVQSQGRRDRLTLLAHLGPVVFRERN